jgi:hypothetical protein
VVTASYGSLRGDEVANETEEKEGSSKDTSFDVFILSFKISRRLVLARVPVEGCTLSQIKVSSSKRSFSLQYVPDIGGAHSVFISPKKKKILRSSALYQIDRGF